jgi:hypothetical protein
VNLAGGSRGSVRNRCQVVRHDGTSSSSCCSCAVAVFVALLLRRGSGSMSYPIRDGVGALDAERRRSQSESIVQYRSTCRLRFASKARLTHNIIAHYGCELLLTVTPLTRSLPNQQNLHQHRHLLRISFVETSQERTNQSIVSYRTIPSTPLARSQVVCSRKNAKDDDAIG